jgi:cytochrome c5
MAVELGLTEDGLNLDAIPQKFKGVTCYFCHSVADVTGMHNNPLELAMDGVMRGAIDDPVANDAHRSEYSAFLDERTFESAELCGTCHDIVNPNGVHLERTYAEWQATFFSDADPLSGGPAIYSQRCGTCHMVGLEGYVQIGPIADFEGVRADRRIHGHRMAAVDTVLDDFPGGELTAPLAEGQRAQIDLMRLTSTCAEICVNPDGAGGSNVDVYLHNEFAAHAFPSGATQDRRVWLELHIFDGVAEVLTSGAIPDGVPVDTFDDPLLWQFRSRMLDQSGNEVHMFWEAHSTEEMLLPGSEVLTPMGDASTWRARRYNIPGPVDRVTTAVHLRPVSLAVLDDLIASGDLDLEVRDTIPTFTPPPTALEWTMDTAVTLAPYGPCVSSSNTCGASLVGAEIPQ